MIRDERHHLRWDTRPDESQACSPPAREASSYPDKFVQRDAPAARAEVSGQSRREGRGSQPCRSRLDLVHQHPQSEGLEAWALGSEKYPGTLVKVGDELMTPEGDHAPLYILHGFNSSRRFHPLGEFQRPDSSGVRRFKVTALQVRHGERSL